MQADIQAHLARDPKFALLIQKLPFPEGPSRNWSVYYGLLESIASQQLSVKAADTIFNRFLKLFPEEYPSAEILVDLSTETLRGVGLSNSKANYMRNVATYFLENDWLEKDWSEHSDEELIKMLSAIKGVGKWTVEMILMFILQRPDVLPVDDLIIRQGMVKLYNLEHLESKKELYQKLHEVAEPWRPYRSFACRYLWKWKGMGWE
jgi:DNA-3-methyladenine glycosylase II